MRIHLVLITVFWIARLVNGNSGFTCPTNWWQRHDRCYIYWDTIIPLPYESGKIECAKAGAQLYVPNSESEFDDVADFLTSPKPLFSNYVWIGCDEEEDDGVFKCVDGSQLNTSNDWWMDSEPEPGNSERCIDIDLRPKSLLDSTCTDVDIVLCEASAIPIPTTTGPTTHGDETTSSQATLSIVTAGVAPPEALILPTTTTQTIDGDTTTTMHTNIDTTVDTTTTTTIDTTTTTINATSAAINTDAINVDATINTIGTDATTLTPPNTATANINAAGTTTSIIRKAISKVLIKKASASAAFKRQSGMFSLFRGLDGSPLLGYCLEGHTLEKHNPAKGTSKIQCAGLCLALKKCRSFNLQGKVCTLNSRQKDEVMSSFFVSGTGCKYYERSL